MSDRPDYRACDYRAPIIHRWRGDAGNAVDPEQHELVQGKQGKDSGGELQNWKYAHEQVQADGNEYDNAKCDSVLAEQGA